MERNPGTAPGMARKEAQPTTENRDSVRASGSLDACYGRIGIPAVAAAVTRCGEQRRPANDRRAMPYDRD